MQRKSPRQSRFHLFPNGYKNRKRHSTTRVVVVVVVLAATSMTAIFTIFNLMSIRAQNKTQHESEERMVLRAHPSKMIPALPEFPIPFDEGVEKWHFWATKGIFGSYKYSPSTILHFPYTELDPSYKSLLQQETRALEKDEYPPAIVMKGVDYHFIDPTESFALTRKGFKPPPGIVMDTDNSVNQDRLVVMDFIEQKNDFWIGLFDGHGELGHVTSQMACLEFPARLSDLALAASSMVLTQDEIKNRLKDIFINIDQSLPHNINPGGSTAISIWKHGKSLYMSNVGDSKAFLASYDNDGNNVKIISTTEAHKPDLPAEKKRIETSGGMVQAASFPGDSARVIIPVGETVIALAMSRSLGDAEGKKFGVICEPTTEIIDLVELPRDRQYFVVGATDGLFDEVQAQEVAERVAKSLNAKTPNSLPGCLEELIRKSSNQWFTGGLEFVTGLYRDDISVAVHRLII